MQLTVTPGADGTATAEVAAADQADGRWVRHASARAACGITPAEPRDLVELRRRCPTEWTGEAFYERMSALGFDLGPDFRWAEAVCVGDGEALGRMRPTPAKLAAPDSLFDACFQLLAACLSQSELDRLGSDKIYVPSAADRVTVFAPTWCHAQLRPRSDGTFEGHSVLYSAGGEPLLVIDGIRVGALVRLNRSMAPADVADGELTRSALLELPAADREKRVLDKVRRRLADVLGEALENVDPDATLMELGVDSIDSMGLARWMDAALGVRLPLRLVLRDPTPAEIVDEILTALSAPTDCLAQKEVHGHADRRE